MHWVLRETWHTPKMEAFSKHGQPTKFFFHSNSQYCLTYTKFCGILGERIYALWIFLNDLNILSLFDLDMFKVLFLFLQLIDYKLSPLCNNPPFHFSAFKKSTLIRRYKFSHYDLFSSRPWNENDYKLL